MNETIKKIIFIISLIFIFALMVIASWTGAKMDVEELERSSECAKEYGGEVIEGYCIYVEHGNSKSYDIKGTDLEEALNNLTSVEVNESAGLIRLANESRR